MLALLSSCIYILISYNKYMQLHCFNLRFNRSTRWTTQDFFFFNSLNFPSFYVKSDPELKQNLCPKCGGEKRYISRKIIMKEQITCILFPVDVFSKFYFKLILSKLSLTVNYRDYPVTGDISGSYAGMMKLQNEKIVRIMYSIIQYIQGFVQSNTNPWKNEAFF